MAGEETEASVVHSTILVVMHVATVPSCMPCEILDPWCLDEESVQPLKKCAGPCQGGSSWAILKQAETTVSTVTGKFTPREFLMNKIKVC